MLYSSLAVLEHPVVYRKISKYSILVNDIQTLELPSRLVHIKVSPKGNRVISNSNGFYRKYVACNLLGCPWWSVREVHPQREMRQKNRLRLVPDGLSLAANDRHVSRSVGAKWSSYLPPHDMVLQKLAKSKLQTSQKSWGLIWPDNRRIGVGHWCKRRHYRSTIHHESYHLR